MGQGLGAAPHLEMAIDGRDVFMRVYGSDHYEVAVNLNNLAALRQAGGDVREAEELYRRALALKETLLGANHPDVAVTANNLAVLYKNQARYADAERLYRRALTIFERSFGVSHPKAIARRENLAASVRASTLDQ
jgi:tetratricopeptide (TPR) repeat protein